MSDIYKHTNAIVAKVARDIYTQCSTSVKVFTWCLAPRVVPVTIYLWTYYLWTCFISYKAACVSVTSIRFYLLTLTLTHCLCRLDLIVIYIYIPCHYYCSLFACYYHFMSWQFILKRLAGPRLNIKTVLSTYGDFHVKDKTAVRTSYL